MAPNLSGSILFGHLPGSEVNFEGCVGVTCNHRLLDFADVESSFTVELGVRPRTKTGVLLSVGVLEFLTVQFLNGTIKFTVDSG
uniref:Laminin EGF-like domain-containing protein n=1 Tax=Parascaris univalens TaxID=6257 RepID=A0A915CE87_PARUN